jgi:hypothetical protein
MKVYEVLQEDGRIVKGVNTTVDVSTDEIKTQAAKFGNTVDKDGKPPTLSKKVKGTSTNVLFNLGLAEGYKLKLERDDLEDNPDLDENFADGKKPGRKGLSQRVGIPKNATIAQLEKAAKADGEKGRMARWQLNMRRGKNK